MTSTPWPRLLGIIALLAALAGCTSLRRMPLNDDPISKSQSLSGQWGVTIAGYSTLDGVFHGFKGTARWTSAAHDSLELEGRRTGDVHGAEPSGDQPDHDTVTLRVARAEVGTLLYWGSDDPKSTLMGLGIVTIIVVSVAAFAIVAYAIQPYD